MTTWQRLAPSKLEFQKRSVVKVEKIREQIILSLQNVTNFINNMMIKYSIHLYFKYLKHKFVITARQKLLFCFIYYYSCNTIHLELWFVTFKANYITILRFVFYCTTVQTFKLKSYLLYINSNQKYNISTLILNQWKNL